MYMYILWFYTGFPFRKRFRERSWGSTRLCSLAKEETDGWEKKENQVRLNPCISWIQFNPIACRCISCFIFLSPRSRCYFSFLILFLFFINICTFTCVYTYVKKSTVVSVRSRVIRSCLYILIQSISAQAQY